MDGQVNVTPQASRGALEQDGQGLLQEVAGAINAARHGQRIAAAAEVVREAVAQRGYGRPEIPRPVPL